MAFYELLNSIDQSRDEIISFFKDLVRIPSVTGEEREIGELILNTFKRIGIDAANFEADPGRPNIVASLKGNRPGKIFLFNGHMDVVPPGDLSEWDRNPFSAEESDGWIYGRGTVDMKPGLAGMIMATDLLKRSKMDFAGEILLTIVSDEQRGGAKGTRYLLDRGLIRGDFGISGESTDMKIELATKGIFKAEINTYGKSAHAGRPWFGIDAIQHMADLLIEIRKLDGELRSRVHPLVGPAAVTIGTIQGGCAANMVANNCTVSVDRRFLPHETDETIKREFESIFQTIKSKNPEFRCELKHRLTFPGMELSPEEPIIEFLKDAVLEVKGREPQIGGKLGGTDAAWIYHSLGIPMVHFAPGETNRGGTAGEAVRAEDIVDATKVYALCILGALGN